MRGIFMWITLSICIESYGINGSNFGGGSTTDRSDFKRRVMGTPMHKAVLTQRRYIQFLRWQLPVPEMNEFTFCEWVKSTNLTYSHSIFSYSKNEKDRLVRAWITPFGRSINLEINNIEIFSEPVFIVENQWYHICQSWDNRNGRYGLWIDGSIRVDGTFPDMAGHVIPSSGDIVLGQEYTDFNKGLEEGIEGEVLGFNFLLASAFDDGSVFVDANNLDDGSLTSAINFPKFQASKEISSGLVHPLHSNYPPSTRFSRKSGTLEATLAQSLGLRNRGMRQASRIPLGLRLIESGYYNCQEGRGSPFIANSKLLISWTRTPVRVFGGAILKNVDGQCGVFNS